MFAPTASPAPALALAGVDGRGKESSFAVSSAPALQQESGASPAWSPPWLTKPDAPRDPFQQIVIAYASPSSIETIDSCLRKYAFDKLDGLPRGGSAAAALGSAMHAQHERYRLTGVPFDLTTKAGELASATLHLLPELGIGEVEREVKFAWPSVPGLLLGGKLDLNWRALHFTGLPNRDGNYLQGGERLRHIVLDHKSSSNVQEYGKLTKAALLEHPQAPIYGAWGLWFALPEHAHDVELRWNYVNTRGKPTGTPSWHVAQPEEIHSALEQYAAPGARRMLQVVQAANEARARGERFGAAQLPFPRDTRVCAAFGGCSYRTVCGITPAQRIVTMVDQQTSDFMNRIQNPAAAAAQAALPGGSMPADPRNAPPGYMHSAPPGAPPLYPPQGQAPAQQAWSPPGAPPAPPPGATWQPPVNSAAQAAPWSPPGAYPPAGSPVGGQPAAPWQPPAHPNGPPGYEGQINPPEGQQQPWAPSGATPAPGAQQPWTPPSGAQQQEPAQAAPKKPGRPRKQKGEPQQPAGAQQSEVAEHEPASSTFSNAAFLAALPECTAFVLRQMERGAQGYSLASCSEMAADVARRAVEIAP